MLEQSARLLEERTGAAVPEWLRRIHAAGLTNEIELRAWLQEQDIGGYPQQLLVHETFGYPDFLYADRLELRPIYDAVIDAALGAGTVTVQGRKGFVSLMTPRRKFAIVKATTKDRVDLMLRIEHEPGGGRLQPLNPDNNNDMNLRVGLQSPSDVDSDVRHWLSRAYRANV
jgi:hypothetical protein